MQKETFVDKEELVKKITANMSSADRKLFQKAYKYSDNAHRGQMRASGDEYIYHPLNTSLILSEIGMDITTIVAGVLHDTIEDCNIKKEDFEKEFGKEILFLVEGVTKLGTIRYQGMERHIKSLQKLFLASSRDIRVIVIKLCDRLHNMRTPLLSTKEKKIKDSGGN